MTTQPLPHYFLYGEPSQAADPDFIHVEDLATRSRPGDWRIAPHRHADLNHLLLITQGSGTIQHETETLAFAAPALLTVPATCVHGFAWQRESAGFVLTIADAQVQQVLASHPEFTALFATLRCLPLDPAAATALGAVIGDMASELSWVGLGQSAAVNAGLLRALVLAARACQAEERAGDAARPGRALVARFRQLVEQRYRSREPVGTYARLLGVSETSLRQACAASGQAPAVIRDKRAVLEAQRLLAFSALPVAAVGDSVGFADAAYFSRFFTRQCGVSPAQWRAQVQRKTAFRGV